MLSRANNRSRLLRDAICLMLAFALARWSLIGRLESPIVGWRPTDLGAIALNFYRHGFHLLYPQVFWGADGPGYVEMEFPIVSFATALLFRLFGVHEWLQLVVPLASGIGLTFVTYAFGCRFLERWVGLAAGLLVAVCPTLAMVTDTGLWADPPMVLFATLGVYWLARWAEQPHPGWLLGGVVSVALAILIKLPALYVGIPVAYLFLKKYGRDCWKSPIAWLAATVMLLPSALWYWHAHQLFLEYHNTFGIIGSGYSKFGNQALLGHPLFYEKTAFRLALYHLTPIGALALAYGSYCVARRQVRNAALLGCFVLSGCLYVLVAAGGVWDGHYHYLLPVLPAFALTAGVGATEALRGLASLERLASRSAWLTVCTALALVFVANVASATYRFEHADRMFDSWMWERKKATGQRLKPITRPDSLLIVADTQMDGLPPERSMTPPDVFYFSDRRGWYLSLAWLSVESIERLHARGAAYFTVSGQSIEPFKQAHAAVFDYLSQTYEKIMDDDDGVAFDLTHRAGAGAPH